MLIIHWLVMLAVSLVIQAPCPTLTIGQQVLMNSGDVFDGQQATVFQIGTFQDGTPGYVVKMGDSYLGVSGCEVIQ